MSVWQLTLLIMSGYSGRVCGERENQATPAELRHVDDISELADVSGAGAHRGPRWYDYKTSESKSESKGKHSSASDHGSSLNSDSGTWRRSSGASSMETKEKLIAKRSYRECTPCPLDMIRKHTNIGIKWICGAYQRARRTFKSECMMRFRNCQDGTMFIKVSDHRCSEDAYHGRHWFYIYKV